MKRDSLGQQARLGISWNLAGAVVTNGMRIVVLAVLGRALTSRDFGIVAAAVSVNAIVYSIRDVGLGPALVQRKQLEDGHLRTAFATAMYVGVVLAAALFLTAPLIARVFSITESVDVIYALALLFVLRNIAVTSRMVARRDMNFRMIAIFDASSFAVGSIAAMIAAVTIGGPWSLVLGYWVEEIIVTFLYLRYSPPKWSLRIERARLRELLGFGAAQTVTQVTSLAATYGDNIVVGRALGPSELGFYSRAFDLVKFPALIFGTIVGSVLFPAFSKIQDDRARLASGFRRIMFVNALVLLPASAALIVLAPEVIRILVGPNWDSAVLPFQILATTIAVRTNQRLAMLVATASGRVRGIAVSFVAYVSLLVGGAAVSVQWGIAGVAVSTSIATILLWIACCYVAMDVSGVRLGELVRAHVPGLALSGIVVAAAWPSAVALRHILAAPGVFAIVTLAAIALCAAAAGVLLRQGRGEFGWLRGELRRVRDRLRRRKT